MQMLSIASIVDIAEMSSICVCLIRNLLLCLDGTVVVVGLLVDGA